MQKEQITILLVDDNEKFLNSMAQRAKLRDYNVVKATNGEQALEIASKQTIHVAVVDQQMPGMEGLVVITKLKAIAPDIKTLLLTGHGDEKLKEATQALNSAYFDKEDISGFWDFLAKISQLALLPQGHAERKMRAQSMVTTMDNEGFGNCGNERECENVCPKGISIRNIARLNREYLRATLAADE